MNFSNEQMIHDLEQRHLSLRKEHEIIKVDRDSLHEKVTNQQGTIEELRETIQSLNKQLFDKDLEYKQKESRFKETEQENSDFRDRLNRRSEECDRLRDDIKIQAEQLINQQSRLKDTLDSLSQLQNEYLPIQLELNKKKSENEFLKSSLKDIELSLQNKNNEIISVRRELKENINGLEQKVSLLTTDNSHSQDIIKELKDSVVLKEERINSLLQTIKSNEIQLSSEKESFLNELSAQKKLVDLYKKYFEETTSRVQELEYELNNNKTYYQQKLHDAQSSHEKIVKDLQLQLEELSKKDTAVMQLPPPTTSNNIPSTSLTDTSNPITTTSTSTNDNILPMVHLEGLSITELFDRVIYAEKQMTAERQRSREVEVYLQRILKDVESKAPILAAQRRDYHRVLESHEKLSERLEDVGNENTQLKEQLQLITEKMTVAVQDARELEHQNKDLCHQLQHLLKRQLEASQGGRLASAQKPSQGPPPPRNDTSAGGVISEFLVTYDDITDLQTRNIQLLKVVRKLSEDQEQAISGKMNTVPSIEPDSGPPSAESQNLKDALRELRAMRDARKRTEEMVIGLVQQRDMYKAMLDEADLTIASLKTSSPSSSAPRDITSATSPQTQRQVTNGSPRTPQHSSAAAGAGSLVSYSTLQQSPATGHIQELQKQLQQKEDEKAKIIDKLQRFEEIERSLVDSLDKTKAESSALRVESAHHAAEAKFQVGRTQQLEEALKSSQVTVDAMTKKRTELEGLLLSQQHEIKSKEDSLLRAIEQHRALQESLQRVQVALEVSQASEHRLEAQLTELRGEMRRQTSLTDTLMRIEGGLTSRAEEQLSTAVAERDGLMRDLVKLRQESSDRILIAEQRFLTLEDEMRSSRSLLAEKEKELAALKGDYIREQAAAKAGQERADILEKQLSTLQQRLSSARSSDMELAVTATDNAQTELALERASAELASVRIQLQDAERHVEQFRRISTATESMLTELRARSTATKDAQQKELEALLQEIEAMKSELAERRQSAVVSEAEVEEMREALAAAGRANEGKLSVLQQEKDEAVTALSQQTAQLTQLQQDVLHYQQESKAAHDNYTHELQLHAVAVTKLRSIEGDLDQVKLALSQTQQAMADQTAAMIQKETFFEEEARRTVAEKAQYKTRVEELQHNNDLLHSQIQSLGLQLDKLQNSRIDIAASSSSLQSTDPSDSSENIALELTSLRKTSVELREVIRFMKRERDTLEAKLSIATTESARHLASFTATQKLLDESRAELMKEIEKRSSVKDDSEFSKLMAEINQLNVVRESNAHLRSENVELQKRYTAAKEQLQKLLSDTSPLQDAVRQLELAKAALGRELEASRKETSYWKDRLHNLVSRYNDVDPEDHRQLVQKLEEANKSVLDLQQSLGVLSKEKSTLLAKEEETRKLVEAKDIEINSSKVTYDKLEKNAEQLRQGLRMKNKEITEVKKRIADASAEVLDLRTKVAELTAANDQQKVSISQLQQQLVTASASAARASAPPAAVSPAVPVATVAGVATTAPAPGPTSHTESDASMNRGGVTSSATNAVEATATSTEPGPGGPGAASTAVAAAAPPTQAEENLRKMLLGRRMSQLSKPATTGDAAPSSATSAVEVSDPMGVGTTTNTTTTAPGLDDTKDSVGVDSEMDGVQALKRPRISSQPSAEKLQTARAATAIATSGGGGTETWQQLVVSETVAVSSGSESELGGQEQRQGGEVSSSLSGTMDMDATAGTVPPTTTTSDTTVASSAIASTGSPVTSHPFSRQPPPAKVIPTSSASSPASGPTAPPSRFARTGVLPAKGKLPQRLNPLAPPPPLTKSSAVWPPVSLTAAAAASSTSAEAAGGVEGMATTAAAAGKGIFGVHPMAPTPVAPPAATTTPSTTASIFEPSQPSNPVFGTGIPKLSFGQSSQGTFPSFTPPAATTTTHTPGPFSSLASTATTSRWPSSGKKPLPIFGGIAAAGGANALEPGVPAELEPRPSSVWNTVDTGTTNGENDQDGENSNITNSNNNAVIFEDGEDDENSFPFAGGAAGELPLPPPSSSPPPTASPFLTLRPPSPSSAGNVKLVFGSQPKFYTLPVPSLNIPVGSGSGSGSTTPSGSSTQLWQSGESLFGARPFGNPPAATTTSSTPSASTPPFVFSAVSPATASFLVTASQSQQASLAALTPPPPPTSVTNLFGSATSTAATAAGSPFGSYHNLFHPKPAPPLPAAADTTASQLVEEPVKSAMSWDSATGPAAAAVTTTGDETTEAPIVSLSATIALSLEERALKRRAKFASESTTPGSGVTTTTTPNSTAPGSVGNANVTASSLLNSNRKRIFPGGSTSSMSAGFSGEDGSVGESAKFPRREEESEARPVTDTAQGVSEEETETETETAQSQNIPDKEATGGGAGAGGHLQ